MPERITHPDIVETMRDGAPVHDGSEPDRDVPDDALDDRCMSTLDMIDELGRLLRERERLMNPMRRNWETGKPI